MPPRAERALLGPTPFMSVEIALIDNPQSGKRQHLVHRGDILRPASDQFSQTTRRHCLGLRTCLSDHSFEDAVHQTNVAVVKTDLNVVDGPCADYLRGLLHVDPRWSRGAGEQ